jgi:hypothetical protein
MSLPIDDMVPEASVKDASQLCSSQYLTELLELVRESTLDDLPNYTESLTAAFARIDPVFLRPRYADFFWHCASRVPGYVPRVVLTNGKAESDGSVKLLELWQQMKGDPGAEEQVMTHATDESRHARIFVHLTEFAFPNHFAAESLKRFEETLPDVRKMSHAKAAEPLPEDHVIDHLVQMNIGEIRTRLHVHLFAPVVCAMAPESNQSAVRALFKGLVRDEVRHISYTASLMERWSQGGARKLIRDLYLGRLHAFNGITYDQTQCGRAKLWPGVVPGSY